MKKLFIFIIIILFISCSKDVPDIEIDDNLAQTEFYEEEEPLDYDDGVIKPISIGYTNKWGQDVCVTYIVFSNKVHSNGYVIILNYTFNDITYEVPNIDPEYYISNIHQPDFLPDESLPGFRSAEALIAVYPSVERLKGMKEMMDNRKSGVSR